MTILAGVLSDTHLSQPGKAFRDLISDCFADCSVIIHAGDMTDISVLEVFRDKKVYAVHGNMCNSEVFKNFPESRIFTLGNFSFGLTHGARLGFDIESGLWDLFPETDCMIYGHTHRAVCHTTAGKLIINPGSFQSTGRYGAPGTYAIIKVGESLEADIHQIPQL